MTRKLIDEYELWGLKLNVKKTKYMAIVDTSRDLQIEDEKGIISQVNEYTYLGVRITKDGNHEPQINDGINPLVLELDIYSLAQHLYKM